MKSSRRWKALIEVFVALALLALIVAVARKPAAPDAPRGVQVSR